MNERFKCCISSITRLRWHYRLYRFTRGSPFKTAVELSVSRKNVVVIARTNLPMLAEVIMARPMGFDLETLAGMAINTGKDQVTRFELASIMGDDQNEDNEDFSNGI